MVDDFANDGFGSPDSSIAGGSIQLASDLEQEQDRPQPGQTLNPDTSSPEPEPPALQDSSAANNPRISKHGLPVPKVPSGIVKKIASRSAKGAKLNKETIKALDQATDWFFEQLSSDLSAYAAHANRKTIDESDVVTLMRRQRVVNKNTSVFALAQRNLPGELIQDLRLGRSKRR
ncbi:hypothetical protein KEM56_004291 [Ascosphaera pollenicola]|nr:hypothetical protein KEM56_004291 [Ascosphaera pollenicola]